MATINAAVDGIVLTADATTALNIQSGGVNAIQIAAGGATTIPTLSTSGSTISSGNLAFTGTGQRITGDMSNATLSNRLAFQTSTTNGSTGLSAIPNGTGSTSAFALYASSDPANSSRANWFINASEVSYRADITGTGTYLPMTFYTNGSERVRIDTSGNVGIGTASVAANTRLRVNGGRTILQANSEPYSLAVEYGSGKGQYYIGATDSATTPALVFSNIGGAERMRVDHDGNVAVGYADATRGRFGVFNSQSDGAQTLANSGLLFAQSGGWAQAGIYPIGSAGFAGTLVFATSPSGSATWTPTERMRIDSSGNVLVGLTSTTANGGVLQISNGITFPATQSAASNANTLDDYEEGTYTPTFGGTSSNPTVTYTAQTGAYTKIGNMVYFYARITISAVSGGSGALQISVPFTPRSGLYQAVSCIYASLDLPANTVELAALLNGDVATVTFNACYDNAATTDLATSALTASTTAIATGCYVI